MTLSFRTTLRKESKNMICGKNQSGFLLIKIIISRFFVIFRLEKICNENDIIDVRDSE